MTYLFNLQSTTKLTASGSGTIRRVDTLRHNDFHFCRCRAAVLYLYTCTTCVASAFTRACARNVGVASRAHRNPTSISLSCAASSVKLTNRHWVIGTTRNREISHLYILVLTQWTVRSYGTLATYFYELACTIGTCARLWICTRGRAGTGLLSHQFWQGSVDVCSDSACYTKIKDFVRKRRFQTLYFNAP